MAGMADTAQWARWVAEWRLSGLSSKEFCADKLITAGGLRHMAHRLGKTQARSTSKPKSVTPMARVVRTPSPTVLATAPAATSDALLLEIGGARIAVRPGFDRATLAAVLEVLGEQRGAR